jgi:hypothetical protein
MIQFLNITNMVVVYGFFYKLGIQSRLNNGITLSRCCKPESDRPSFWNVAVYSIVLLLSVKEGMV